MSVGPLPRCRLATLPTPLLAAPRLSEAVGIEVWVKRDDLTGLLLGGNKARKLEFLCGEALAQRADTLVTGGGPVSNHVPLTAAAAARLGLGCVAVVYGTPPPGDAPPSDARPAGPAPGPPGTGEPPALRLTRRLGAEVIFTGSPDRGSVDTGLADAAAKLAADGRRPYVIPRGGASAIGAVGYALAALELAGQLAAQLDGSAGLPPATVLLATGSCGTQAGLLAGTGLDPRAWARTQPDSRPTPFPGPATFRVVGVPVSRPPDECTGLILRLAAACAERLGSDRVVTATDVHLLGGHLGPGYGKASPEGGAAAALAARTEGLLLDPVFTAKAMAALIAEARAGRLPGPVVFLHTGGTPAALAAL